MVEKQRNDGSDFGTPETQKQGDGITLGYTQEGGKVAKLNGSQHFDLLRTRGTIDDKQWQAGEYLKIDAGYAHQFSYIKISDDRDVKCNTNEYAAEAVADAKKRFDDIIALLDKTVINGFSERDVVMRIVVTDGYLNDFTRNRWKVRQIRQHLINGLDKLIKYYGV